MKITGSSITMASSHEKMSYVHKETVKMEAAASKDLEGAILSISEKYDDMDYKASMMEYQKQQKQENARKQKENQERMAQEMMEQARNVNKTNQKAQVEFQDEYKLKLEMIRRLFDLLAHGGRQASDVLRLSGNQSILDLRSPFYRSSAAEGNKENAANTEAVLTVGTTDGGTLWQRVTATSGFMTEMESTTFASQGCVTTEDGRRIDFNVEVSMTRAFMASINTLETETYIMTDPLMINLDTDVGTVSDQKFLFDLDEDGEEEEISFAGKGSGFLALDRNGDGIINDGSELFGTKSGDGFKDLAVYDSDGNGWIDENDGIYSKLKVWTKDEEGKDRLIDLKEADVGAIYLGNAKTEFSLKDDENRLNGQIRKTGIYLHESTGAAGTMNHVDLVV